ncbi:hypothetical protein [Streptomyces sporangiiformans]|uniref:Cysteinyl-tRNA synthetase n=1 Tax=Streptomyces sporangiiformans TaxID=2315329 RepID=A0A505D0J2_9ACTN|nr:hypothetical protein [Streptomyces sporangiiformans]TPQ16130.1 hypothetical protein FGD71_043345 [Streptomyces sporangiiformans]
MLQITDARTGEPTDAAPARRGLTRVEAHVPRPDTTGLRVLLVADVLVRALELNGTPVWTVLTAAEGQAELRERATALGVRPFEEHRESGPGLGEAQVLHVLGAPGPEDKALEGVHVEVAPVHDESTDGPADEESAAGSRGSGQDDPSALRLALLARPRRDPVRLGAAALADAEKVITHWRGAVAAWATRPSSPIPDPVREQLRAAWEDDLDVPAVLDVLRRVATSDTVPDGARFETYAFADRLLGLELTRDIGRGSPSDVGGGNASDLGRGTPS